MNMLQPRCGRVKASTQKACSQNFQRPQQRRAGSEVDPLIRTSLRMDCFPKERVIRFQALPRRWVSASEVRAGELSAEAPGHLRGHLVEVSFAERRGGRRFRRDRLMIGIDRREALRKDL